LSLLAGVVGGLIVGAIGGWFGHRLTLQRSSSERRIQDSTERIDRTRDMVAARRAYAAAWHHQSSDWHALRAKRDELEVNYPLDLPANVLGGTDAWEAYVTIEKHMLDVARQAQKEHRDDPADRNLRAKEIEDAGDVVLRDIEDRRSKLRR
jgi:hypothetical protein